MLNRRDLLKALGAATVVVAAGASGVPLLPGQAVRLPYTDREGLSWNGLEVGKGPLFDLGGVKRRGMSLERGIRREGRVGRQIVDGKLIRRRL